jgi:GH25 family lysozyme M1 (1,4-beta-N-acetylmuramidase)
VSLYADIAAAQAQLDQDRARLAVDQASLDTLLARQVRPGPDVSEHNGDVDWTKVATAADVAFTRVSDGDYNDKLYTAGRVTAIRAAGLPFVPYHYCRIAADSNGQRTARAEAGMAYYFASRAGWGRTGDMPLALDVEQDAGETATFQGQTPAAAAAHVSLWIAAYVGLSGHRPIVYTNPATARLLVAQMTAAQQAQLAACPLWVAHWGVAAPTVPAPWQGWTFWQHTSTGTCPGVTGSADLNRFSGSKDDLAALRIA